MKKLLKRIKIYVGCVLMMILIYGISVTSFADENGRIENSKNGIVKIVSGLVTQDGVFYGIKVTSGFIISNTDNSVYIITTNSGVSLSENTKNQFFKEKNINKESSSLTESIRVMVEGDVNTEVSIVAKSDDEDFCILNTENVIQEREALSIENSKDTKVGDNVYALGFRETDSDDTYNQYDLSEVNIHQGNIQDTNANISGNMVIQHSTLVDIGNTGGPLLNSDGYVIGINNVRHTDTSANAYYAMPINVITKILDNYGVIYNSSNRNEAINKIKILYSECEERIASKKYTNDSNTQMDLVLQEIQDSLTSGSITTEQLYHSIEKLENSKVEMQLKTPKTFIVIIVLAVVSVILIIWLLYLLIIRYKKEKQRKSNTIKRTSEQMKNYDSVNKDNNDDERYEKANLNVVLDVQGYREENTECIFENKTEILSDNKERCNLQREYAKLRRVKTGQIIILNKEHFKLGKNPELSDFSIDDNNAVSRVHAIIKWQENKYKIYDMNSTNGTFVNGERVRIEGCAIKNGDEITLANEVFTFSE